MEPLVGKTKKVKEPSFDELATRKAVSDVEYLTPRTEARKRKKAGEEVLVDQLRS